MQKKHYVLLSIMAGIILFFLFFREESQTHSAPDQDKYLIKNLQESVLKTAIADVPKFILYDDSVYLANGSAMLLSSLLGEGKLCLLLNDNQCRPCAEQLFAQLESMFNPKDILIIVAFRLKKDYRIAIVDSFISKHSCYIRPRALAPETANLRDPFLFWMDSTFTRSHLMLADRINPELTRDYLSHISSKYKAFLHPESDSITKLPSAFIIDSDRKIGTIKRNTPITTHFTIVNRGTSPLIIHDIESSCGCTVPKWTKDPINPGDSTTIEIVFDAKDKGFFHKTLFLHSNTENSPQKFSLSGSVK